MTHTFTLEVAGIDARRERFEDALYKAGCNDATIAVIDGKMFLDFDREGPSLQQAVNSARDAVHSAGGEVVRIISALG